MFAIMPEKMRDSMLGNALEMIATDIPPREAPINPARR
jgi:hypothetical protein